MDDGETFAIAGGGDAPQTPRGGEPGMLYVTVRVAPHARFRREGDDLWVDEEVSFLTFVRGGTTTIRDLEGKSFRLKIPAGTPSGKVFRVSGRGLPRRRTSRGRGGRGDLFVTVHARVPQHPSERLVKYLEEVAGEL